MTQHSIELADPKTNGSVRVVLELDAAEVKIQEAFVQYAEELGQVEIVKTGVPCGLTVISTETGFSWRAQVPEDRDISQLLHRLRPLILTTEHASYDRATGVLGRRGDHASIRAFLKGQREIYDGRAMHQVVQITSINGADQALLNSDKVLFDWLNSYEYHRDQGKKEEIERFHQLFPVEASRPIFLMQLWSKVQAIMCVADFTRVVLGKTESYTLHLPGASGL